MESKPEGEETLEVLIADLKKSRRNSPRALANSSFSGSMATFGAHASPKISGSLTNEDGQ